MPLAVEASDEHIRSRSEKPPEILYRYMSVKTALAVLKNRTLRFHSPLNYNDPFDSQWDVLWPVSGAAGASRARALLEKACRDPNFWPVDADPRFRRALTADLERISRIPADRQEAELQALLEDGSSTAGSSVKEQNKLQDLRRRLRILCFSTDDSSVLMWSHYGENHQGVVLGFNAAALEQEHRHPLEKVRYEQDLPNFVDEDAWTKAIVFGLGVPSLRDERGWALTKSNCWEYEQEWRFIWVASKGTETYFDDIAFPAHALVRVFLGCKTNDRNGRRILRLAQDINPELSRFQTMMHPAKFDLQRLRLLPYVPQRRSAKRRKKGSEHS